ncbi:MAG: inclusion body family protein [Cyanobacteria bacterium SBLK]|nr:inclusion body family protein [Cyanobacteria bacterium SBLK]
MKRLILFFSVCLAVMTFFCAAPTKAFAQTQTDNVEILIVIDTQYIKDTYGRAGTVDNPKGVNHHSQYMIADYNHVVEGQGTADLVIKAGPRDTVKFTATSTTANSDDAVIVYGIEHWDKSDCYGHGPSIPIMNPPTSNIIYMEKAVMPSPGGDGLPPTQKEASFASLDSQLNGRKGAECYKAKIAIFSLNDDQVSQGPDAYGYYYWDPAVIVE